MISLDGRPPNKNFYEHWNKTKTSKTCFFTPTSFAPITLCQLWSSAMPPSYTHTPSQSIFQIIWSFTEERASLVRNSGRFGLCHNGVYIPQYTPASMFLSLLWDHLCECFPSPNPELIIFFFMIPEQESSFFIIWLWHNKKYIYLIFVSGSWHHRASKTLEIFWVVEVGGVSFVIRNMVLSTISESRTPGSWGQRNQSRD